MRIDKLHDALIVVDLQPDFMPGGSLAVAQGDQLAAPIGALSGRFATVVATQDWHPPGHVSFAERGGPWPVHCLAGSRGAAVDPALPDANITLILRKGTRREVDSYSAFAENDGSSTGLGAWLQARGIERVFVCGLARDVCVRATAVDAAREGFRVVVLDDLTRAVDPAQDAAIAEEYSRLRVELTISGELQ